MAADIVHDLELDRCPSGSNIEESITPEQVDGIRTYLSCYYLVTTFAAVWAKLTTAHLKYTTWTTTACDALERLSPNPHDLLLAWLIRHAHTVEQAAGISRGKRTHEADQKLRLMMLGLESQQRDWQDRIPPNVASLPPLALGTLFAEIFIHAAPLLKIPAPKAYARTLPPDPQKVPLAIPLLARFFGMAAELDHTCFSSIDWVKFIMCVVLGMRLSFPIPGFPAWDHARARAELRYGDHLERLCTAKNSNEAVGGGPQDDLAPASKVMDIGSASRVILRVVQKKYLHRLERLERMEGMKVVGCPMLDGSLEEYFPMWEQSTAPGAGSGPMMVDHLHVPSVGPGWGAGEGGSGTGSSSAEGEGHGGRQIYHDLWATMTMGWAVGSSDSSGT